MDKGQNKLPRSQTKNLMPRIYINGIPQTDIRFVVGGLSLFMVMLAYAGHITPVKAGMIETVTTQAVTEELEPADVSRLCSLSSVICDDEAETVTPAAPSPSYDISAYATNPSHEATVAAILANMPAIADKYEADAYIKSKRPASPVRGGMVERAATEYGVDMRIMLALMQNDSAFGTAGLGARTRNPGNIANRDDGHTFTYPSWEDGVRGVARWLSKHSTK